MNGLVVKKMCEENSEYVKINEVTVGALLITDYGFTCMEGGIIKTVQEDEDGLFVDCDEEKHHLDGQISDCGEYYIGFRKLNKAEEENKSLKEENKKLKEENKRLNEDIEFYRSSRR